MDHRLINQLTASDATEDEIKELYEDLRYIFENPFDCSINEAISQRGCAYIEQTQLLAN